MVTHNRFIIVLIIIVINATLLNGQNIQSYDSSYTINNIKYLAKYEFYISGNDTIYDGEFELSQQFENQEDIHEYLSVEGSFIENRADENWKLKKGAFEPTGKGYYKNYTYSYDVNGHEFMAEGKFLAGKKTGEWRIYDWQIRNSKITDTTLTATINFKEDEAQGNFRLQINEDVLEGELEKNEMTKGIWSFYRMNENGNRKLVKEWVFEDNTLVAMRLRRNDQVEEIKIHYPGKNDLSGKIIPLDDEFLEIIELKARIFNEKLLEKYKEEDKISNLYFTLLDNLDLVDKTFSPITKSTIKPTISSKLLASNIKADEESLLKKLKYNYEANQLKTKTLLDNPQINIASLSTKKVELYRNVLQKINQNFLIPTKEILSLYDDNQLKFFERDELIQYKIKLTDKETINGLINSDSLSEDYQFQSDLSFLKNSTDSNLFKLSAFMESIEKELNSINENLRGYIAEIQNEEKLVELEDAMLVKYEKIKTLADSLITGEHDNFARIDVAQAIKDFANSELEIYSNLATPDDKINVIESLITCFSKAEELIYTIQKSTESIYKINEAYTKEVFNPYTFTNMEEKSKPSIYKAFNKLILPSIFKNMRTLNCDNLEAYKANFKILFDEMIILLNESSTNRMERKVKRAKTAEKAAEILEMELSF
ncbi:hypothetical protein [Marivirga sp.]|uniref:hypothetical protein n=1 Tax=Marivirga sp. TaxID=2018662 RepID=UPI002D80D88B|nr:hypothetical protein [Marivirga sp.]HET8858320.1 hypothetical protein [Marivirga sp.]